MRILFRSALHFEIGLFGFFMSDFLSSLYGLEIITLLDVGLVKIVSHSVGCSFVLLMMSFALRKFFSFMRSHLLSVLESVLLVFYSGSCLL